MGRGVVVAVVVTGAAGFIGRRLVARLRDDGHDVIGIDRRHAVVDGTVHVRCDLAGDDLDVVCALRGATAVFHLAASPGVRAAAPDIAGRRWADNVLAGERVLDVTRRATPVIVVSSSAVYGGARPAGTVLRPSHEDDRPAPRGGYARSKVVLEQLCARRAGRGGHVAVVRPFTVVGEEQRPDMALASWLAAARAGRPLAVHGDAGRRRDLTDVDDVVEVLVRVWRRGIRTTVNAGTGRPVTLRRMLAVIAQVLDVPVRTEVVDAHPDEVTDTRADTTRCRALLGMAPSTDLYAVVARQIAARRRLELLA
jgi:nucleoside-diphosphate-sugar epimerase